jgi:hypothetical protein
LEKDPEQQLNKYTGEKSEFTRILIGQTPIFLQWASQIKGKNTQPKNPKQFQSLVMHFILIIQRHI